MYNNRKQIWQNKVVKTGSIWQQILLNALSPDAAGEFTMLPGPSDHLVVADFVPVVQIR